MDELGEHGLEREGLGPIVDEGEHDDADGVLQRGELVELVEDDVGVGVAFDVDDDSDAVTITVILDIGDAGDAVFLDGVGDFLNETDLLLHVGDFGDDDFLSIFFFFDLALGAKGDGASAGAVAFDDSAAAANDSAGGEVGSGDAGEEIGQGCRGVIEKEFDATSEFSDVVWRDAGGHADGDSLRAVG